MQLISHYCYFFIIFFGFRTGFRPTKGGRLIWLMSRGMRTGQALFPLGIESGIPRVRPWKELLATGAPMLCLKSHYFLPFNFALCVWILVHICLQIVYCYTD